MPEEIREFLAVQWGWCMEIYIQSCEDNEDRK
jgi:hypothetical protein